MHNPSIEEIITWRNDHSFFFGTHEVLNATNKVFGFNNGELASPSKEGILPDARKCYAWFSIVITRCNESAIGERINRSRPGIIRSIESAQNLIDAGDEQFIANIQKVYTELKQLLK